MFRLSVEVTAHRIGTAAFQVPWQRTPNPPPNVLPDTSVAPKGGRRHCSWKGRLGSRGEVWPAVCWARWGQGGTEPGARQQCQRRWGGLPAPSPVSARCARGSRRLGPLANEQEADWLSRTVISSVSRERLEGTLQVLMGLLGSFRCAAC